MNDPRREKDPLLIDPPAPSPLESLRPVLRYAPFGGACILLILVFVAGFWVARASAKRPVDSIAQRVVSYNACLARAKGAGIGSSAAANASQATSSASSSLPVAYSEFVGALLAMDTCSRTWGLPFYSPRDLYDITGVRWFYGTRLGVPNPVDPIWLHPDVPRKPSPACDPSGLRRIPSQPVEPCSSKTP